jgi:hypothetical protein
MKLSFEQVLIWRQTLVENAKTVELGRFRVSSVTSGRISSQILRRLSMISSS